MKAIVVQWSAFTLLAVVGVAIALHGSGYYAQTLFTAALFILLSLGWNVISGIAGYVSFGQVSFFGFGAYIAALAMLDFAVPWYVAAGLAMLASVLLALILGGIMLRLNGIFFALGMFGLARILQITASGMALTGGPMGTTVPPAESPNQSALAMVIVAVCATIVTYWLTRSRLGLRLMAIRDDELAAQAAGVDTFSAKITALCISAAFAAAGGGLYVWNIGYLDPGSAFNGSIELQTVLMVLAGGIGTVWGPVIGGVLVSLVGTFLWARFPMEQQVILGALTIFVATVMPGGIMAAMQRCGWIRRQPIWGPPQPQNSEAGRPRRNAGDVTALSCRGLGVRFGGVVAVDNVDVEATAGEMLAIIGPNGAGKSTLFSLISNFLRGSGEVQFGDEVVGKIKPYLLARRGIARTFQTSRLFASLSVWETVLVAASCARIPRSTAIRNTTRILEETGLIDDWRQLPESLPPGRQRLLEIARALALSPRVLLLDEAMAGMTLPEIEQVHAALRRAMADGCAVVAIEHVLPAIVDLATRVQVLDFGRTIAEGSPREVLRDPIVIGAYMGTDYEREI